MFRGRNRLKRQVFSRHFTGSVVLAPNNGTTSVIDTAFFEPAVIYASHAQALLKETSIFSLTYSSDGSFNTTFAANPLGPNVVAECIYIDAVNTAGAPTNPAFAFLLSQTELSGLQDLRAYPRRILFRRMIAAPDTNTQGNTQLTSSRGWQAPVTIRRRAKLLKNEGLFHHIEYQNGHSLAGSLTVSFMGVLSYAPRT